MKRPAAVARSTSEIFVDCESSHHSDNGAKQTNHGRDDAYDGEIAVARAEERGFAHSMLGERTLDGLLAAANAVETAFENVREVVAVRVAGFPSLLIVARNDELAKAVHKWRWRELLFLEADRELNDQRNHDRGSGQNTKPDENDERATMDDGTKDTFLLGSLLRECAGCGEKGEDCWQNCWQVTTELVLDHCWCVSVLENRFRVFRES